MGSPRRRILLVEDYLLFKLIAVGHSKISGYSSYGWGGYEKIARVDGEFAAAIIDVGLPDTKGDELITEVRGLFPTRPIIISSGCTDDALRARSRPTVASPSWTNRYLAEQLQTALGSLGIFGKS